MSSSPDNSTVSPLEGTVVVDLSDSVAGQYAGRMLAMHGADVTLVEPLGGSATRRLHPLADDDRSYLYRHLNQGKRSIELSSGTEVAELVEHADVIIREQGSEAPAGLPDTVIDCVIGDFPDGGPYEGWDGPELIQQALSGVMAATGDPDREPIYGVGHRASYAAGTTAYISIVAALHERRRSGLGQQVGATVYESAAAMGQNIVSRYSYNGSQEGRGKYAGFLAIVRCRDAWVVLFALSDWPGLCRIFHRTDLIDDPRFTTGADRLANWEIIIDILQEAASSLQADDVVAACQAGRVSAEKVSSLGDLVDSEHWRAREMLTTVKSEDGREERALRRLFVIDGADTSVRGPSPRSELAGAVR